jgi:hypothetical protein
MQSSYMCPTEKRRTAIPNPNSDRQRQSLDPVPPLLLAAGRHLALEHALDNRRLLNQERTGNAVEGRHGRHTYNKVVGRINRV